MKNFLSNPGFDGCGPADARNVGASYYSTPYFAAASNCALGLDSLLSAPYYTGRGGVIDRMGVTVVTPAGAGKKARLGIYRMTSKAIFAPTGLIVDSGEIAIDAGGNVAAVVNQVLPPNEWVWLTVLAQANVTISGWAATPSVILGWDWGVQWWCSWWVARAYGALPNPHTAGGTLTSAIAPQIILRYSA